MGMIRYGVCASLEAQADAIIKESLAGVTRHSDKSDILTPWKEMDRRNREVYVESGTPDPTVRRGVFHRNYNPERLDLNSREGLARGGSTRGRTGSLSDHVEQYGSHGDDGN